MTQITANKTLSYYGLRARPCGFSDVPKGPCAEVSKDDAISIFPLMRDQNNVRHGAIAYEQPLESRVVDSFELVPLDIHKGVETQFSNSIPENVLQVHIVGLLAKHFHENGDAYTIKEIEYDGEDELKVAFEKTSIFECRKEFPAQFKQYSECLDTIHPDMVIRQLTALKRAS